MPRAWIHFASRLGALFLIAATIFGGVRPVRAFGGKNASGAEAEKGAPTRVEQVSFRERAGIEKVIAGRVLVEAEDGGLLVEEPDGRIRTVEKEQLVRRVLTDRPFAPLDRETLGRQLGRELGGEAEIVVTRHYVICSVAGKAYGQWCGALFERLYAAFQNYWRQRGVSLHEPEFPLPALVFANERQFAEFAARDVGPEIAGAKGYYSIASNRMVLYDLTAAGEGPASDPAEISRRLAAAPFNVATVIHEATHQIAFNSGMHTRYADNPLWLTEGMAMYFETPDLTSRSGWKTVGAVNDFRLRQFQAGLSERRGDALATLIRSDARFTDPEQTGQAYAEAWALSYFLIKTRKQAYADYLNSLARKPRLIFDEPAERLRQFQSAFGTDLSALDAEFIRYMRRVK